MVINTVILQPLKVEVEDFCSSQSNELWWVWGVVTPIFYLGEKKRFLLLSQTSELFPLDLENIPCAEVRERLSSISGDRNHVCNIPVFPVGKHFRMESLCGVRKMLWNTVLLKSLWCVVCAKYTFIVYMNMYIRFCPNGIDVNQWRDARRRQMIGCGQVLGKQRPGEEDPRPHGSSHFTSCPHVSSTLMFWLNGWNGRNWSCLVADWGPRCSLSLSTTTKIRTAIRI